MTLCEPIVLALLLVQTQPSAADPSRVLDDARALRGGAALHGTKMSLEGTTRNAYVVTEAAPLRGKLRVEPGMRLEVSFALLPDDSGFPPPPIAFTVSAQGQPVMAWQLDSETTYRWMSDVVDLGGVPGLAGKEVALSLSVGPAIARPPETASEIEGTPPPEPPTFGGFTALIGDPIVLRAPKSPPPNVVLISIDTLRADHLGCYGYSRPTSPRMDQLAKEGVRFAKSVSTAPWTTPAHMSLVTGLYPSAHHVNEDFDRFSQNGSEGATFRVLAPGVATLATLLRDAGWRTHALTAGVCVEGWIGFDRGFDSFHSGPFKLEPEVATQVGAFLDRHAPTPFFLFLHTYEAHEPYTRLERARKWLPPAESEQLKQLLLTRSEEALGNDEEQALTNAGLATSPVITTFYDAGVETADAFVGFVIDRLKALGIWERTLLVVTADHGQELADHDPDQIWGMHGHTLYDELLHVPLLMHVPGEATSGAVVDGLVQTVDVAPTILELVGLEPPEAMQGVSVADLARKGGTSPRAFALSESTTSGQEWKALRLREHKLLAGFDLESVERSGIPGPAAWEKLFDLAADPREQHDLAGEGAELLERLRARLIAAFGAITLPIGNQRPGVAPDEDLMRRLRELGYAR